MMGEIVKTDCRHYLGDRPCGPHKLHGVHCHDCTHYEPIGETAAHDHTTPGPTPRALVAHEAGVRVVIVKLDAMGDVLRTTPILYSLREQRPRAHVTWITRPDAVPLLEHNELIDRVVPSGPEATALLAAEQFDVVLGFDAAPQSATLATLARVQERLGFGLNDRGAVVPFNPEAEEWWHMGLFDDVKQACRKTYQQIAHEIARLPYRHKEPVLRLTPSEEAFAQAFARQHTLHPDRATIGLNTGAGKRWAMKKWRVEGYLELIERLGRAGDVNLLLLGGPEERERNQEILRRSRVPLVDAGCDHPVRQFAALITLCDVVVTGDTIGVHLATALKKKAVVLFGPTSATEIELYGLGRKVLPDRPCQCYYLPDCRVTPTCMDRISADAVFQALEALRPWRSA